MTLANKIQKGEFVIFVSLVEELVHYFIISAAPKKAAYHSDMRTFIESKKLQRDVDNCHTNNDVISVRKYDYMQKTYRREYNSQFI